jgi:hypothetical protein
MTAKATLPIVLQTGIHSARPAAADVGKGGLYSCTTHSLVYQTDGSSWTTWATLGTATSGALIFLEAHTATNASGNLDFTTFISSTYDTYKIIGTGINLATNTADLNLEVGTGGGPTYDTGSNYEWVGNGYRSDGVAHTNVGASGIAKIFNSMSNAAGYGNGCFDLTLYDPQSTSIRKEFLGTAQFVDSSPANCINTLGISWTTTATAITALRFHASSGNIVVGTIRIYGVSKS